MNQESALVQILRANSAEVFADFIVNYNIEKDLGHFKDITIFVPNDNSIRLILQYSNIPITRLCKLSNFHEILLNHFAVIHKDHIKSVNGSEFAICKIDGNTILDANHNLYVTKQLNIGMTGSTSTTSTISIKLFLLSGVLVRLDQKTRLASSYLETLPFDLFIALIEKGNINGMDLINLSNTSAKLKLYFTDRNEFLFKRLLSNKLAKTSFLLNHRRYEFDFYLQHKTARELYIDTFIGGKVYHNTSSENIFDTTFTPLNQSHNQSHIRSNMKQISTMDSSDSVVYHTTTLHSRYLIDDCGYAWRIQIVFKQDIREIMNDVANPFHIRLATNELVGRVINRIEIRNVCKAICATYSMVGFLLDEDGQVWFDFGNVVTKLNLKDKIVDICASRYNFVLILTETGNVINLGDGNPNTHTYQYIFNNMQPNIRNGVKIIKIASAGNHLLCLDNNQRVWAYGDGDYGQLGLNKLDSLKAKIEPVLLILPPLVKIIDIATGYNHSALLDTTGSVWTFGSNHMGQLLNPNVKRQTYKPTKIPLNEVKLKSQEKLIITSIIANDNSTNLIDKDGNLWCADKTKSPKIVEAVGKIRKLSKLDHIILYIK